MKRGETTLVNTAEQLPVEANQEKKHMESLGIQGLRSSFPSASEGN